MSCSRGLASWKTCHAFQEENEKSNKADKAEVDPEVASTDSPDSSGSSFSAFTGQTVPRLLFGGSTLYVANRLFLHLFFGHLERSRTLCRGIGVKNYLICMLLLYYIIYLYYVLLCIIYN